MIRFPCPSCGVRLTAKPERAGRRTNCPRCKAEVEVPVPDVPMPGDYYERLQVSPSADPEVIAAAYRRLSLKYHPDRNPDGGRAMALLNEANETLGDPERRAAYDRKRAARPDPEPRAVPAPTREPAPFFPHLGLAGLLLIYAVAGPVAGFLFCSWCDLYGLVPLIGAISCVAFINLNARVLSIDTDSPWIGVIMVIPAIMLSQTSYWNWGTVAGLVAIAIVPMTMAEPPAPSLRLWTESEFKPLRDFFAVASACVLVGIPLSRQTPDRYRSLGFDALERMEFRTAEDYFDRAIAMRPSVAASYEGRAYARKGLGNGTAALEDASVAVGLEPDNESVRSLLASLLAASGRHREAIEEFTVLIDRVAKANRTDRTGTGGSSQATAAHSKRLASYHRDRAASYEANHQKTEAERDRSMANRYDLDAKTEKK